MRERSWKCHWKPPCLAKVLSVTKLEASCSTNNPNTRHTRYACIAEAHESVRERIKETQLQDHADHVAETGFNSLSHFNLVHKPIPPPPSPSPHPSSSPPQAIKIPDGKAAVDRGSEKLAKFFSITSDEIQKQKRGHRKGTKRGKKHFTLQRWWTCVTSRIRSWSRIF